MLLLILNIVVFGAAGVYFAWVADKGLDGFLEAANRVRSLQELWGVAGLQGLALAGLLAIIAATSALLGWLAKSSWQEARLRLKR